MDFLHHGFASKDLPNSLVVFYINSLLTFQIFLWWTCNGEVDLLYQKDVCDEAEFFVPYVRLLRTRQPYHENSPILKLLTQGYIDVSKHTGILCINGPAIVYTDITQDTNPKCKSGLEWIPSSGEPEFFSHDCFSINRFGRDLYKQPEKLELKKESEVYGNKVFGVYLLGLSPDYRMPTFTFFSRPDYGFKSHHSPACIHEGISVAFMANSSESSSHCYSVKNSKIQGTLSTKYSGNPMFCFRDDRNEDFDTPFHNSIAPLFHQDIIWTNNCAEAEPGILSSKAPEPEEPMDLPDFRMIDPKLWSSQGSQAVVWKATENTEGFVDPYSKSNVKDSMFYDDTKWTDSSEFGPEDEATNTELNRKFRTQIFQTDCEEIPTPSVDSCIPQVDEPCNILNHVLTLEETDWKTSTLKEGRWRRQIFQVINKIFEKVCPQVSKYLPSSLSRNFQQFLFTELDDDKALREDFNLEPKSEWQEILADLNNCEEKAEMMQFFKKNDTAALKLRKKLENKLETLFQRIANRIATTGATPEKGSSSSSSDQFERFSTSLARNSEHMADLHEVNEIQRHLMELPLKFPYKILIGTPGSDDYEGATQVFHYREAAEVDYELDWALDAYWKVISTSIGYCYTHYAKKEPATFQRIYDSFTVDFLKYIYEAWINGDNRPVYEQIYGDFIHGSGALWLDACYNGAYQWSEIVELRPLRPLELIEGDIPPNHIESADSDKAPAPPNFFLDNPIYSKLTVNQYDYYDEEQISEEQNIPDSSSVTLKMLV